MYGSKATCCLPGGQLLSGGLQPTSVFAPDSSSSVTALAALSPASKARFLCSAAPNASSPSSCLRPNVTSSQISLHRRPFWRRGKSPFDPLPFSRALSVRATQRRQRVLRLSSHPKISISFPFSGDQFCSRTRLCKVLNADANPEVEIEEDDPPNEKEAEDTLLRLPIPYIIYSAGVLPRAQYLISEHFKARQLATKVLFLSQVNLWTENEMTNDAHHTEESNPREQQQQPNKLHNRVVFGAGIGAVFLGFVLAGGWVFTLAFSCVIWVATGEYFELVRSKGNVARGMIPPPPVAAKVCAAICSLMPIMTLYFGGRMGVVVTTSAFGLAMVLLLQKGPRFSQLTSAIFGLIYCGYLPSFWIKLRCGLNIPALNTRIAAGWPILFGGQAHWTVGLVATIISCSAIAAADTFSFLGGKIFGKTPLIAVSPKKTLEGAVVGLSCTVALTILLSKLFQWPSSTPSAAVLAVLVFMSSLFGDLTESMMKRDAGVKDSGHLIPGHGGILDRVDSYVFTGALVYSFVKIGIPLFGV